MKSQFDPYTDHPRHDHELDSDSSRNGEAPVGMALDDKRQHSDKVKLEWTNRDEHLLTGSNNQKNVFVLTNAEPATTFKLKVTNDTGQHLEGTLFVQLNKVVKQVPNKGGKLDDVPKIIPLKGQKDGNKWYEIGDYLLAPGRRLDKGIEIHAETLKRAYQEGGTQIATLTFLFQWRPFYGTFPGEPYFNQKTARFILANPIEFKGKMSPPDKELARLDPNDERKYRIKIPPVLESTDQPIKTEYKITESWTTTRENENEKSKKEGREDENKRTLNVELGAEDFLKTGLDLTLGASWEKTVKITTEIVETFRSKISTEFGTSTEKPVRIEVPPPKRGDIRNAFLYPLFERYYVEAIVLSGPSKDGYATERKSIAKFPMLRLVNWKVGWDDYPKEQKKTSAARSLGDGTYMRPSSDRAPISDRLPVIVIDPGHGGDQRVGGSSPNNATGPNGALEKDMTLDLARRLRAILSPVAKVALTRDGDVNLSLADRARAARDRHADLFLSIHLNGFNDPQTDGTEVWVARDANPQSRAFAQAVLRRVQGVTGVRDRGVRQSDLGVILPNRHDPRTAACLLEVAFLTNSAQAQRLAGEAYKQRIAEAMAAAVRQHLRAAAGAGRSMAAALDGGTTAVVSKPIPLAFFSHKFDEYVNKRKQPLFKLRINKNKASITFDQEFAKLHGLKNPMEFSLGHLEVDLPGPFNPDINLNDINTASLQFTVRPVEQSPSVKVLVPEFAFKLIFETNGTEIEINNFPDVDLSKLEIEIRMKLIVEKGRLSVIPDVATSINWSINNLPDGIYNVENKIKNELRSKLVGAFNDDLRRKVGEQLTRWLLGGLYEVRALSVNRQDITIDYVEPKPGSFIQPFPEKPQPKTTPGNLSKIDHIVVLMMENRSFDHMLGYLSLHGGRKDIDGLKGNEKNVYKGREFRSFPLADTPFPESPCHDYACVLNQTANGMGGFVTDFASRYEKGGVDPGKVMGYYRAEHVPVYDVLAREFGVCDRWFCTHPGPTWPNRFQSLSGRLDRDGFGRFEYDNPEPVLFTPSHAKTIFDHLEDRKVDWRYYEHGYCFLRLYSRWTTDVERIRPARDEHDGFFVAAREGRLPAVSFIDPKFIDEPPGNDDHPPADVRNGQRLVAQIVTALMNGPRWNKTLLIITYDEHGGFFDHVVPPRAPDVTGIDRYGPRVPALIVSPWIERGKVSHTVFDHCSILRTIVRRFCAANPPDLGERVNKANDVGELLTLAKARTDRPKIPMPAGTWQFSAESLADAPDPFSRDYHSLLATMRRRFPVPRQRRADRTAATHALEAAEWSSTSILRS